MKFGDQARVLRLIPGLEQAEFLRFGQIHRNTYINAPALLQPTLPLFITCPAMLSVITVTGMRSRRSSHAVSREPCMTGRVSSTHTSARRPRSWAARITPTAVP